MTDKFKGLFEDNNQEVTNGGANQLDSTAQLTQLAETIAREVLAAASEDAEASKPLVAASQESHNSMDELINEYYNLEEVDIEFLKVLDADLQDRMIKSQQSKRSRAKSRTMTMDNYMTMMTGAVAENLVRIAANKPKQNVGRGPGYAPIEFSDDELQAFAEDAESLRRAIRNIQSKKSIMRRRPDFDTESDRWKELLAAEATLKEIRDGRSAAAQEAVEINNQMSEALSSIDPSDLEAADAKELLAKLKDMMS